MENRVRGAWLVHNANKLAKFATQDDFEATYESGRAGVLLSALSSDTDVHLDNEKVQLLAKANNISQLEAKTLLLQLRDNGIINIGEKGITVLEATQRASQEAGEVLL